MNISVKLEKGEELNRFFRRLAADQVPFATATAINKTALQAQAAQRDAMKGAFTVRNAQFVDRSIKIKPFATKYSLEAVVSVSPPGGQKRADILPKFEEGGEKTSATGAASVAVAGRAARGGSQASPLDRKLTMRSLKIRATRTKTGKPQWKGKDRTFIIRSGGRTFLFQRTGPGRGQGDLKLLYNFKRGVPIPKRLGFQKRVTDIVARNYAGNFKAAFASAVGSAR